MKIAFGTCGYSYKDWIGPVYPPGTTSAQMLELYARRFTAVEIDSTYYRVPSSKTFESMARRTPAEFRFTAKLPGSGTHLPDLSVMNVHDDVSLFRHNIEPLAASGKLACVLMQFPNSFRPSATTHEYIAALCAELTGIELVAEFRNRQWQTSDTLELLQALGIGLVNVDQPQFRSLLRPSTDVTSRIAYLRFHGRNYQNWWKGTNESRYDYLYSAEELTPWVDRVVDIAASEQTEKVFAFFNNHRRGQAVRNAEMLEEMLQSRLPAAMVITVPDSHRPRGGEPLALDLGQ